MKVLVDLLVARDKCWNHANVFQVHSKDVQSFLKVIQRGLDRGTSVVPYIISGVDQEHNYNIYIVFCCHTCVYCSVSRHVIF